MSKTFDGKVAIVTGAANGIGKVTAARLASLGASLVLVDLPGSALQTCADTLKAAWMGDKLVAPALLRRGGGTIVNTASVAGLRGSAGLSAYSISKHAVIGLTRSAASEYAALGVRVNAVCPGPINTAMGQQLDAGYNPQDPQAGHERVQSRIPMARYGKSEEVAALVCFLLSDEASYITGAAYPVDGGMTA